VRLDGEPLAKATVSFHRPEGSPLTASTDATGSYTLELTTEGNAALGKYAVRIRLSKPSLSESNPPEIKRLPARYNDNTELVVDILDGQNTIDFDLSSISSE